ncbi:MAG: Na(+)-translocating NADH-quinone reductase subunit A [Flavobacteriales bacterium TMED288]|nr:NADH:ubiquinone reductase (Na(+)-transporting) subunit A [Flavobacteriales bacterium]RPG53718.1 MAG: Na(+)-translocating NADH-quinone reductase subunit A [Flavobacteriales bacterium TMED288]|tara:strand:+ start:7472 stop:8836 length:1365 start_codon:yes stop_codon:yes gene_type:complete
MSLKIKIKKGIDIRLKGVAEKLYANVPKSKFYSIDPSDFIGITPKLAVKEKDVVLSGDVVFFDKKNPNIKFTSPVSGSVTQINRGAKRKILSIIIESNLKINYKKFKKYKFDELDRNIIVKQLLESGLWPSIRQRPFAIIANPNDIPKSIHISTFDTSPLACDNNFIIHGMNREFQNGINIIKKLTDGIVHLNIISNSDCSDVFKTTSGVQINQFSGPHPSGNIGTQIHHIDPINKGEVIWYLYTQDIIAISKLFENGIYDASKLIALGGSQVKNPRYYRLLRGASIENIISDNIIFNKSNSENRYISGNVLTGKKIDSKGYLGYYHNEICVIPEGNNTEFLGWLLPGLSKFSLSRTFYSWLNMKKKYTISANMNGEERAYVVTGQYEKIFPMDIYPQQLIKATIFNDIELMEKLGIYEVAEEDFALCEFSCTSKIPIQKIIRDGLNKIQKEFT